MAEIYALTVTVTGLRLRLSSSSSSTQFKNSITLYYFSVTLFCFNTSNLALLTASQTHRTFVSDFYRSSPWYANIREIISFTECSETFKSEPKVLSACHGAAACGQSLKKRMLNWEKKPVYSHCRARPLHDGMMMRNIACWHDDAEFFSFSAVGTVCTDFTET
jgi:hypothetical protein